MTISRREATLCPPKVFKEGTLSDATVHCGPHAWKVHRKELSGVSQYFYGTFGGALMEAKTGVVTLLEIDDVEAIDAALEFAYTKDLKSDDRFDENVNKDINTFILRTYKAANYFLMGELEEMLLKLLATRLELLSVRWQRQQWSASYDQPFKDVDLFAAMAGAVELAYTDNAFSRQRAYFVNVVRATHWFALSSPGLDLIMEATPEFGCDVLRAYYRVTSDKYSLFHMHRVPNLCAQRCCGFNRTKFSDTRYFAFIGLSARNELLAFCNLHADSVKIRQ